MKYIFTLLLLAVSSLVFAQSFSIGNTDMTFTDATRGNRSVTTKVYYPATAAGTNAQVAAAAFKFPVVVFGHGLQLPVSIYQPLWEKLVPMGFVVVLPTTEGSSGPSFTDFAADLNYSLDACQKLNVDGSSVFFGKLSDRGAIGGHSMGGGCSMMAAADKNIATCVFNFSAVQFASSKVGASLLMFGGEKDCAVPPSQQKSLYNLSTSSCKAVVVLDGADHCQYALADAGCQGAQSSCGATATITEAQQQQRTFDLLVPFLRWQLLQDYSSAKPYDDLLVSSPNAKTTYSCSTTGIGMPLSNPAVKVSYSNQSIHLSIGDIDGYFTLIDMNGRRVLHTEISAGQHIISTGQLPAGIYLYQVQDKTGQQKYTGKLSVQ